MSWQQVKPGSQLQLVCSKFLVDWCLIELFNKKWLSRGLWASITLISIPSIETIIGCMDMNATKIKMNTMGCILKLVILWFKVMYYFIMQHTLPNSKNENIQSQFVQVTYDYNYDF
jgi:hypothetical protein